VRVYRWDLLLFAFGVSWIVFATQPWMLIFGYVLTGLAVGADIPASWTLVVETAPAGRRGERSGAAQLLWGLGPVVVLTLAFRCRASAFSASGSCSPICSSSP
jgi:inositol transporter-like SP family MFS transporter